MSKLEVGATIGTAGVVWAGLAAYNRGEQITGTLFIIAALILAVLIARQVRRA